jgi:hypothetical protein
MTISEVSTAIAECKAKLQAVETALATLNAAILESTERAYYQPANAKPLSGEAARCAIVDHLLALRYSGIESSPDFIKPIDCFMALACDTKTLELAYFVNMTKIAFHRFHYAQRKPFKSEKQATEFFRYTILAAMKEKLLNIHAVDRKLPILPVPATLISWHYNHTASTEEKTVADAIEVMSKWTHDASDPRIEELNSEIDRLAQCPGNMLVSHRRSVPVTSLRCRAMGIDEEKVKVVEAGYGKNPVLYLAGRKAPNIRLPFEITGEKPKEGRGRPKILTDTPLSPFLKDWLLYREPRFKNME